MREASVVIVGGGPAGLSAAGALERMGVQSVVLDRDDRIGGSWARRYERLHLHTVRRFSGLAHFPIPTRYPRYLSKNQYAEYLQEYANHLGLQVELNTNVVGIRREHVDGRASAYIVETPGDAWRCSNVVIATGKFCEPSMPEFRDIERFRGISFHASSYHTGRAYAGKRVLVVGLGNTGAEIAADLIEQGAAGVTVSVRTSPTIVPRDALGLPIQETGMLLSLLPPSVADRIAAFVARFTVGNLSAYGIGPPQWTPFINDRPPVIDVGFLRNLKAKRITARPDLRRFTNDGVEYADGREEAFDVVILATGFTTGLERILKVPETLDASGAPRRASPGSTPPGLYFIGYRQTNRGLLFETEIDSRRLATAIAANRAPAGRVRDGGA